MKFFIYYLWDYAKIILIFNLKINFYIPKSHDMIYIFLRFEQSGHRIDMTSVNKIVCDSINELPKLFLADLIFQKLKDSGVEDRELADKMAEHVFSQKSGDYVFSNSGKYNDIDIQISLNEADINTISEKYQNFVKYELPNVVKDTVLQSAKNVVHNLEENWPHIKIHERNDMRRFRASLDLRWSRGLDPLRMLLIANREIGENFTRKLMRSKAKKGIIKREAITILHMRACQTSLEILTLLENGLADGAYARWRTLYEISVVANIIDRFGDDVAEKYFAHHVVSERDSLKNQYRFHGRDYIPHKLRGHNLEIENEYVSVIKKFGEPFARPYGWAAESLGIKNPRFQDLEESIDFKSLHPEYKWSSYKVHAGVSGSLNSLGIIGDRRNFLAGASNAGLQTPAINTAYSLVHLAILVVGSLNNLENLIQINALLILRDKVVKECSKISKNLEKEEMHFDTDDKI